MSDELIKYTDEQKARLRDWYDRAVAEVTRRCDADPGNLKLVNRLAWLRLGRAQAHGRIPYL